MNGDSPRPSTVAAPADLAARREAMKAAPPPAPLPGVEVTDVRYAGVPCMVCEPPDPRGVLLYLHGGGYRLGSAALFAPFAMRLALATGRRVVSADYRLAPENPFPAALDDAVAVHEHLAAGSDRPPLAVGDSAGGGLAAALVVACGGAKLPVPSGLVLMSAWLDLRCDAGSYRSRGPTDHLFSQDAAREAAGQYLQGHDAADPLASPLLADPACLGAFPPALLLAGTDEVLLDDSAGMAASLARAGVPTTAHFVRGVPHAWPTVRPDLPESTAALGHIARFIESQEDA